MTESPVRRTSAKTRQRCGRDRKTPQSESRAGDMCRDAARSTLTKLLTAVLVVLIICLPELFQNGGGNPVVIWCSKVCGQEQISSLFSLLNVNSFLCLLRQRPQEKKTFLKLPFNDTASVAAAACRNTSRKLQHPEWFSCESEESVSSLYQQLKSTDSKANGYLEVQRRNHHPLRKDFQVTMPAAEDDVYGYFLVLLDIDFRNSTPQDRNTTSEKSNSSHKNSLLDEGYDCINISLHLESYPLSPICTTWIIWLVLIVFVLMIALNISAYKVMCGNKEQMNFDWVPHRRRSSNFVHTSLQLGSIPEHNALQCINDAEATENLVDQTSDQDPDGEQDSDRIFI